MSMSNPTPRLLGKGEVQQILCVSDRTLEKLVRARQFPPPLRLGKTVRWAEPVVLSWLEERLRPQMEWKLAKRAAREGSAGEPV